MRARFNGHAPKGQKFIAQRQAKRRPGYNVPLSLRHVRAKVLKQSVLYLLCPCRAWCDMAWRFTQGIASLALGYGGHWAFSPLGLTGLCATMTFQPASFDRDEQSVTYSWYAENPFKIHRPRGPSKKKELTDP